MKTSFKNVVIGTLALAHSAVSFAGCVYDGDRGNPHPDAKTGTKYWLLGQHGTWKDWIYHGWHDNKTAFCPWNSARDCEYRWTFSKTQGYSTTIGFQIDAGGIAGKATSDFIKAAGLASFNAQWTKWLQTTQSFVAFGTFRPGQYAIPIIIQERAFSWGYMQGYWYETRRAGWRDTMGVWHQMHCYQYSGGWYWGWFAAHIAVGTPYRSFEIKY